MAWRNQYIFIDSCSSRTLSQHKYRGQRMSTWLSYHTTRVLLRNPALGFARVGACSITGLQQQQLTQDPSQQGKVGPANYPLHRSETPTKPEAAAPEGTASLKENTSSTKNYFQTITQSLSKQCMVFQKKEVHKVTYEEWHRNRNIRTKQLGKPAKKLYSQNRM